MPMTGDARDLGPVFIGKTENVAVEADQFVDRDAVGVHRDVMELSNLHSSPLAVGYSITHGVTFPERRCRAMTSRQILPLISPSSQMRGPQRVAVPREHD